MSTKGGPVFTFNLSREGGPPLAPPVSYGYATVHCI